MFGAKIFVSVAIIVYFSGQLGVAAEEYRVLFRVRSALQTLSKFVNPERHAHNVDDEFLPGSTSKAPPSTVIENVSKFANSSIILQTLKNVTTHISDVPKQVISDVSKVIQDINPQKPSTAAATVAVTETVNDTPDTEKKLVTTDRGVTPVNSANVSEEPEIVFNIRSKEEQASTTEKGDS